VRLFIFRFLPVGLNTSTSCRRSVIWPYNALTEEVTPMGHKISIWEFSKCLYRHAGNESL